MSAPLHVTILTEAGHGPGLGHVRRCVALGRAALELGAGVRVLVAGEVPTDPSRDERLRLEPCDWIKNAEAGFAALDHTPADVVVVDSYAVGEAMLTRLGARGPSVVLIDDLADRPTPLDVVVNGGFHAARLTYHGKPDTVYLLGPRYVLLDSAFAEAAPRGPFGAVHCVLITLGGDAPRELFETAIDVMSRVSRETQLDVVVGPFTAWSAPDRDRVRIHRGLSSLRPLMLTADLAITAGGMTLYECLASGVPIVALAIADNQRPNIASLNAAGLLLDGGPSLETAVRRLIGDAELRATMSRRGRDVVDGGGARRVAAEIQRVAAKRGATGAARGTGVAGATPVAGTA
jgi:spore coat polysaccharide biosynthesis predicted glycosyltransferase SpsG